MTEITVVKQDPVADAPDDKTIFDPDQLQHLLEAFPLTRIDWERFRWYHILWILYIPIGVLLVMIRILLYVLQYLGLNTSIAIFNTFFIKKNYSHPKVTQDDLAKNSVIVGNHHNAIIEYIAWCDFFDCETFTLVDAKTAVLKTSNLKSKRIFKKRGEKLVGMYQRFRESHESPLIIYPQGATTANTVMSQFMTPIFEAMGENDMIYCLANDVYYPIPMHSRFLGSNLIVDLFLIFFSPFVVIQAKLLGPFRRGDFATPREAADHCQEIIAKAANKKLLPIDVFQKFKLAEEFRDGHGTELLFLHWLQSHEKIFKVLFYPFVFIHLVLKETTVIFVLSIMLAMQFNLDLVYPTLRAVSWTFMITALVKIYYRLPRPLWIDSKIRLSKYVWQEDYSFPSGHVAFITSLLSSLVMVHKQLGVSYKETLSWPAIILITAGIPITCLSRMMLGMHFPVDILFGIGFGILVPFIWIELGCDAWFVEKSRDNVGFALLFVLCIGLGCVIALMHFHKKCNSPKHIKQINRWNKKNQEAFELQRKTEPGTKKSLKDKFMEFVMKKKAKDVEANKPEELPAIEPHKLYNVYLPLAVLIGFLVVVPLQQVQGSTKFVPRLEDTGHYAISVATMLGGMLVLGALIAFVKPHRLIVRTVLCTALVMWMGGYSQFATKLILGQ